MTSHVITLIFYKIQANTLNSFNSELVKSLEGLRERRDNILMELKKDEERKREIENYIKKLDEELENINGNLY